MIELMGLGRLGERLLDLFESLGHTAVELGVEVVREAAIDPRNREGLVGASEVALHDIFHQDIDRGLGLVDLHELEEMLELIDQVLLKVFGLTNVGFVELEEFELWTHECLPRARLGERCV